MRKYKDLTMSPWELKQLIALENANVIELIKIINAIIGDGSPKGVFPTLFALNAKYPNGAKGIYVVTANGHWYYWNGQWSDGGVYQAAASLPAYGTTANRPIKTNVGQTYFDTTINKPIWVNGALTAWVDATGLIV